MAKPVSINLSNYSPGIWDLHKAAYQARQQGGDALILINLWMPINVPALGVAIESGSLYLAGVRPQGQQWLEFMPDVHRSQPGTQTVASPRLPNSRWIMAGALPSGSSYRALGLDWMIRSAPGAKGAIQYAHRPAELLQYFHGWDGQMARFDAKLSMCVLIFLISEALRFRAIESECSRWLSIRNQAGYGSDGSIAHVAQPFVITQAMLDLVQTWGKLSDDRDPGVWMRLPGLPDPLIS